MAVGASFLPNNSNTYIRNHAATGHLVTQYSRNPSRFPLMRYCQLKEVKQDAGYYLRMTAEQAGRMVGGNLNEFVWPDGAPRPRRNNGTEYISWADYRTERYDFDFTLGDKARKQAGWDIEGSEAANHAQQAMTGRTLRVHQQLETNANWETGHRKDVTTIAGVTGRWDLSTTSRMDIKRSMNYAMNVIRRATLAAVAKKEDFRLIMSPTTAQAIGTCQDMVNAFIQSQEARRHFEGKMPDYTDYGIPNFLYGVEVVVEDTVMVTSQKGASTVVKEDVCADGVVYLLSRPGGLVAKSNGGPSFSSMMIFAYEDMTVEQQQFPNDRRVEGHVVDDTAEVMVAPAASFKFENVIA